jgi:hypothetical protein
MNERRGFLAMIAGAVAALFAWPKQPKAETIWAGMDLSDEPDVPGYWFPKRYGGSEILDYAEAKKASQEFERRAADGRRCVEACRIMREHRLEAQISIQGDSWAVMGQYEGERRGCFWYEPQWLDPVDALIAAEPLFLAWKAQREASEDVVEVSYVKPILYRRSRDDGRRYEYEPKREATG